MRCFILLALIVLLSSGVNAYNWIPNVILPNLADYQGRLDDLNKTLSADPQNITALETLVTVYRMMEDTAANLKDRPSYDLYSRAEYRIQNRIYAANLAKQIAEYQKSLGTTEDELATRINTSKMWAYADPLNASAWQGLSDAYDAMANYHAHDDYSKYAFQKNDADNAVVLAKSIQENGIDGPIYYENASDLSSIPHKSNDVDLESVDYAAVVAQAANVRLKANQDAEKQAAEVRKKAEMDAEEAEYRATFNASGIKITPGQYESSNVVVPMGPYQLSFLTRTTDKMRIYNSTISKVVGSGKTYHRENFTTYEFSMNGLLRVQIAHLTNSTGFAPEDPFDEYGLAEKGNHIIYDYGSNQTIDGKPGKVISSYYKYNDKAPDKHVAIYKLDPNTFVLVSSTLDYDKDVSLILETIHIVKDLVQK